MQELSPNPEIGTVKPLGGTTGGNMSKKAILVLVFVLILGIFSGYGVYAARSQGSVLVAGKNIEVVKTENEEGVKDAATFRDTAEGKLIVNEGKITDEGTHILDRGDESQNVYLISTVVDLDKYKGKKVQVWGETYKGQKAGWLMDVGRIKVQ